jgi:hypothetical protein
VSSNFNKAGTSEEVRNTHGDFSLGDTPLRILHAEIVCDNELIGSCINCEVEWKTREDKFKPKNSLITNNCLKYRAPLLLINFYESKIKFGGGRNK